MNGTNGARGPGLHGLTGGYPLLGAMQRQGRSGRLLELDPGLADGLEEQALLEARRELVVQVIDVNRGAWPRPEMSQGTEGVLGFLVVDGLLLREVILAGRVCAELLGPGEVIHPWPQSGVAASLAPEIEWSALTPSTLVLLDRRLAAATAPWPQITAVLVARAVARAQGLASMLAITGIRGLEVRVLVLLWHLADTFGRVGRDGVILPIPLTHQLIGRLAGATRPSVSTALKALETGGAITKRLGGGFVLHGEPPDARSLGAHRAAGVHVGL